MNNIKTDDTSQINGGISPEKRDFAEAVAQLLRDLQRAQSNSPAPTLSDN